MDNQSNKVTDSLKKSMEELEKELAFQEKFLELAIDLMTDEQIQILYDKLNNKQ